MIQKITLALLLILSVSFVSHVYLEEPKEEPVLVTHWKQSDQLVIEQDIEYLKKRVTALEVHSNISTDYLDE
ncbi:hypothetical protein [Halomonas salinarum]|uniref:hypothetical protein n=1 Tax=Halomonas salinarum TaxID=1158993 RepID=UPI00143C5571|nr:hypothetical protein [Halomonas salinarum]